MCWYKTYPEEVSHYIIPVTHTLAHHTVFAIPVTDTLIHVHTVFVIPVTHTLTYT